MDDMLVFGDDRQELHGWAREIERACEKQRLRLHPWQVRPTQAGVPWLGFRILPDAVRIKRSTVARGKRRLITKLEATRRDPEQIGAFSGTLTSTFAHWGYADSYRLREQTCVFRRDPDSRSGLTRALVPAAPGQPFR